ncbi:hypothetical protein G9A89_007581 [Geosiphon pyriformis]|nr:hypothetical protein G9A89_007581 [Geosiphon pyriformis]
MFVQYIYINANNLICRKPQVLVLSENNYFEPWQNSYVIVCGLEFKSTDGEAPKIIPTNVCMTEKCVSLETGKVSIFSSIFALHSNLFLGIFTDAQGIHHIDDVCFENIKNSGWYQYDELQKIYKARAIAIGSSCSPPKSGYTMNFVIYEKI